MAPSKQALRQAADKFHKILSTLSSRRMLANDRPLTVPIREMLEANSVRDPEKLAADGFELCVRALADLGAPDVMIHECGEQDLEHW
jgi:hypothetical protein